jgi:hypothetical protein
MAYHRLELSSQVSQPTFLVTSEHENTNKILIAGPEALKADETAVAASDESDADDEENDDDDSRASKSGDEEKITDQAIPMFDDLTKLPMPAGPPPNVPSFVFHSINAPQTRNRADFFPSEAVRPTVVVPAPSADSTYRPPPPPMSYRPLPPPPQRPLYSFMPPPPLPMYYPQGLFFRLFFSLAHVF